MKMNKIIGLGLAMVLGLGLVGCGDTEIEEQEQTVQQQEVQDEEEYQAVDPQEVERHENDEDENLNEEARNGEYQFGEVEGNDNETVKNVLVNVLGEHYGKNGWVQGRDYDIETVDDGVAIILYLDYSAIANADINTWNELIQSFIKLSSDIKGAVVEGNSNYSHVGIYVTLADREGNIYLMVKDGEVLYDGRNQ